jgi:hypothetical protein
VFQDRLVGGDAHSRFEQQLSAVLRTHFRHTLAPHDYYFTALSLGGGSGGGGAKTASVAAGAESKDGGGGGQGTGAGEGRSIKDIMGNNLSRMSREEFQKVLIYTNTYSYILIHTNTY